MEEREEAPPPLFRLFFCRHQQITLSLSYEASKPPNQPTKTTLPPPPKIWAKNHPKSETILPNLLTTRGSSSSYIHRNNHQIELSLNSENLFHKSGQNISSTSEIIAGADVEKLGRRNHPLFGFLL